MKRNRNAFKSPASWSIRTRFLVIITGITLVILIVNFFLIYGINSLTGQVGLVYNSNIKLNHLSETLDLVQENMAGYLNTKATDDMEDYYRYAQELEREMEELNDTITSNPSGLAEKNIRELLGTYLDYTNDAIEAKRGRNVEKYRISYEKTAELHGYISEYITSLNGERFQDNVKTYTALSATMEVTELLCIIIFVVTALSGILLVALSCNAITTPLSDLAAAAQQVTKGNYDLKLTETSNQDEIGLVTKAFNTMVASIQDNIVKLRQNMEKEQEMKEKELIMEAHLKDAQLKYLQAQINPHFLFNTLNAGAQLAMMEGADRAYDYIQQVASFFRYNIKQDNDVVTLKEELDLVDSYIYILNVRFAGEIGYEKIIDDRFLQTRIPVMSLQPVVENCVNHGIRNIDWEGVITISVYQAGDKVCISIRDNGIGMSEEQIEQISRENSDAVRTDPSSNGIGIRNVRERLKLLYNDPEIMDILSEGPGKGTETIMYIPMEDMDV